MPDNKWRKKLSWLILPLLAAGILVGRGIYYGEQIPCQPLISEAGVRFGEVFVIPASGEIRFSGQIRENEGWVRFLIYLCSYRWLKEEAALVSSASLTDLQKAIALLDWQLWDQLWFRESTGREVEVTLKWPGEEAEANKLIELSSHLGIGDLIFLGSPLFDPLFLARCRQTLVCVALKQDNRCPLFFLQESVEAKFTRPGGAGYYLNSEQLPPPGTSVTVIIRVPTSREKNDG